ncbi:PH domain-like protein, partial [Ramicandelaber brevisporus]
MANHAKTKTPLPTPAQFAEAKDAANLQVLRRLDSSIAKIHATSSHAVVYRFDQSAGNGSWVKYNVEGVLFIIERNTVNASLPKYALFVMNRAGLDNFDYPIQSKSCVMLKGEYIMCQPSASSSKHDGFFGLWVYEQSDRDRIVALVKQ